MNNIENDKINKEKKEVLIDEKVEFLEVYNIILSHRQKVASTINNESLTMIWNVGQYVSKKIKNSEWGDGVVRQLSEFIRQQDPTSRGWSYRTIYKMVQFYETYSRKEFCSIIEQYKVVYSIDSQYMQSNTFMPFEMAQLPQVLYATA